jgi:polyisoprenoid-binding protein YceI
MQTLNSYVARFWLVTITLTAGIANAEPAEWVIDPEHFSIAFEVEHIGYQQQLGMFLEGSGRFNYDPETLALKTGRVEIQAGSIFSNNEDRDKHLTGRDFLASRDNPTIVFDAVEFVPTDNDSGSQRGALTGNLTLVGKTHPVTLDITINKLEKYPFGHRKETLGISARATLLRSRWGIDYGVANNLVGDEVTLRFEFEALRQ